VSAKEYHDGYQYKCKVTDASGNTRWSAAAVLTVEKAPGITIVQMPTAQNVKAGKYAYFEVDVDGEAIYQWQYLSSKGKWYSTTLSGNKTDTLKVYGKSSRDGSQYRCKITDKVTGAVLYTDAVTLGVLYITDSPDSISVKAGSKAKFSVEATGQGLTYQWYYKSPGGTSFKRTTFSGCKTDTLTVSAKSTHNGYQYKCKITDESGNYRYSTAATLTVK